MSRLIVLPRYPSLLCRLPQVTPTRRTVPLPRDTVIQCRRWRHFGRRTSGRHRFASGQFRRDQAWFLPERERRPCPALSPANRSRQTIPEAGGEPSCLVPGGVAVGRDPLPAGAVANCRPAARLCLPVGAPRAATCLRVQQAQGRPLGRPFTTPPVRPTALHPTRPLRLLAPTHLHHRLIRIAKPVEPKGRLRPPRAALTNLVWCVLTGAGRSPRTLLEVEGRFRGWKKRVGNRRIFIHPLKAWIRRSCGSGCSDDHGLSLPAYNRCGGTGQPTRAGTRLRSTRD